jgi:hypothetical protein
MIEETKQKKRTKFCFLEWIKSLIVSLCSRELSTTVSYERALGGGGGLLVPLPVPVGADAGSFSPSGMCYIQARVTAGVPGVKQVSNTCSDAYSTT